MRVGKFRPSHFPGILVVVVVAVAVVVVHIVVVIVVVIVVLIYRRAKRLARTLVWDLSGCVFPTIAAGVGGGGGVGGRKRRRKTGKNAEMFPFPVGFQRGSSCSAECWVVPGRWCDVSIGFER